MEIFGAISAGEYWRSSDLNNGIYSSQFHDFDHTDHQFINSVDDHFDVTNYGLEIPLNIWPSCDSTVVHGMALPDNSCHSNNDTYGFYNFNPNQLSEDRDTEMFLDQIGHELTKHFASPDEKTSLKRSRSTMALPNDGQNNKKSTKSRKTNQRPSPRDYENEEDALSEENSNASQEEPTSSSSPKGKKRATRGSATDPQSIYARKRREKINERLRVLQNLVPNGTKVDISTMLEHAVQYVKFLQLQIKMLSSDELWMYAPLAHNGMNINGVDYLRHAR